MEDVNNPLVRRLATTVIALLLLLYVGYQVYRSHYSGVRTETSAYFTASDSVQVTGVAVRDEAPLEKPKTAGVVDYLLSSGDKVAKGGTVARICSDEKQAAARHELESVDSEIRRLQSLQSPGDTYAASPDSLNQQIQRKLSSLLGQTVSGDFASLPTSRQDLLYLISERQIVTGQASNLGARLTELQKTRETLSQQAGTALGTIISPASGYFISSTDGLESALDFSKALSLTGDQILAAEKEQAAPADGSPGKISGSYDWYFACVVDAGRTEDFRQLASGGTVSIRFPFVSNVTVPATVAAVNQGAPSSQAAVILESNYMNAELAAIRRETAQVILHEYTGIRVSAQAVHFETVSKTEKEGSGKKTTKKEVSGVYVLHGNQIGFRQIVPLYSTENYVICDPNPPEDGLMTDGTVKLHDEVVVEGTDLYDGKVVQ